jgi:hypothetical protein
MAQGLADFCPCALPDACITNSSTRSGGERRRNLHTSGHQTTCPAFAIGTLASKERFPAGNSPTVSNSVCRSTIATAEKVNRKWLKLVALGMLAGSDTDGYCVSPMAALRKRNALPMTLTELKAMAAAAIIGDSKMPNVG